MSKERIRIAGERLQDHVNPLLSIESCLSVLKTCLKEKGTLEPETLVGHRDPKPCMEYLTLIQRQVIEIGKITEQVAQILHHWTDPR